HTGLRYPQKLAGIMALSTYMPTTEQLKTERTPANNETHVFMAHGTMDPVIHLQIAKDSFSRLKSMDYPICWHEYPMQHSLCLEEISDISDFINRVL
ncbi:MAG: carboxylesterase, partial [Methyloprofundus sp.]|nr:carboxylesterase [Methyloprofundus sp.]